MLTVTESAAEHLCSLLANTETPEKVVTRILVEEEGLALRIDQAQVEDETFEHNGRTFLALDRQASDLLANDTLDVKHTSTGPQLFSRSQSS